MTVITGYLIVGIAGALSGHWGLRWWQLMIVYFLFAFGHSLTR